MKKIIFLLLFISTIGYSSEKYAKILFRNGTTKYFELNQIEKITFKDLVSIRHNEPAGIEGRDIRSVYPNPFQTVIKITYYSEFEEEIKVDISIAQGVKIKNIYQGLSVKGINLFTWNGTNSDDNKVSTGFYFYTVTCWTKSIAGKILFHK